MNKKTGAVELTQPSPASDEVNDLAQLEERLVLAIGSRRAARHKVDDAARTAASTALRLRDLRYCVTEKILSADDEMLAEAQNADTRARANLHHAREDWGVLIDLEKSLLRQVGRARAKAEEDHVDAWLAAEHPSLVAEFKDAQTALSALISPSFERDRMDGASSTELRIHNARERLSNARAALDEARAQAPASSAI